MAPVIFIMNVGTGNPDFEWTAILLPSLYLKIAPRTPPIPTNTNSTYSVSPSVPAHSSGPFFSVATFLFITRASAMPQKAAP